MMARFSDFYNQSSKCSTAAAASSSARISNRMDTAKVSVVSIIAVRMILRLRLRDEDFM